MVLVPFKFIPGFLLLAGVLNLFESQSADQFGAGLLFTVIGGVWSYYWYLQPDTGTGTDA